MKKRLLFFLCAVMVIAAAGCQALSDTNGADPAKETKITSKATQQTTSTESVTTAPEQSTTTTDRQHETTGTTIAPSGQKGLLYAVEGLPAIESFSGTAYQEFEWMFPPVDHAVLRDNGEEKAIALDDPRLIRLLNFLMYSSHHQQDAWRQGFVSDAEHEEKTQNAPLLLDIYFQKDALKPLESVASSKEKTPRIQVLGMRYYIFLQKPVADLGQMEEYFPYQKVARQAVGDSFSYEEDWIDILTYCGFAD